VERDLGVAGAADPLAIDRRLGLVLPALLAGLLAVQPEDLAGLEGVLGDDEEAERRDGDQLAADALHLALPPPLPRLPARPLRRGRVRRRAWRRPAAPPCLGPGRGAPPARPPRGGGARRVARPPPPGGPPRPPPPRGGGGGGGGGAGKQKPPHPRPLSP